MATIRKRLDKWQVQVRRKGFKVESRSFLRRTDAEEWARHIEVEADRHGLPPDRKQLATTTLRDIIERYRDSIVSKKKAREVETIILNALLRQKFADTPLTAITSEIFAKYRDQRMLSVKGATVRRELSLLQHAFDIARKEWALPILQNPLEPVRKPVPDRARNRRLSAHEFEKLQIACVKCRNKLIWPVIQFAIETGMRRGELLALEWCHVNLDQRTLHIPVTKNGHPRTIPLTPQAISILTDLSSSGGGRAFALTSETVKMAWRRVVSRAAIADLHFHDLRHEAVSRFFEKGLTVPEVALISGHRDFRMLFRYTHLRAEDVARKLV
jgi:integrase